MEWILSEEQLKLYVESLLQPILFTPANGRRTSSVPNPRRGRRTGSDLPPGAPRSSWISTNCIRYTCFPAARKVKDWGKTMLLYIFETIRPEGATKLRLNVNRYNKARQFYEKMGFSVVKEEDVAIGNNYFMNDYVMEVPVPA